MEALNSCHEQGRSCDKSSCGRCTVRQLVEVDDGYRDCPPDNGSRSVLSSCLALLGDRHWEAPRRQGMRGPLLDLGVNPWGASLSNDGSVKCVPNDTSRYVHEAHVFTAVIQGHQDRRGTKSSHKAPEAAVPASSHVWSVLLKERKLGSGDIHINRAPHAGSENS